MLAGCSAQKETATNLEEYIGAPLTNSCLPSVAQLADDAFYYIDQDNGGLHMADSVLSIPVKLVDGPMNLFAVTDDRIICMDESTLRIYGKDGDLKSTLAFSPRRYALRMDSPSRG